MPGSGVKICSDGRIWGQNDKLSKGHLGVLVWDKKSYGKKYYADNKKEMLQANRNYILANKDKVVAKKKDWYNKNSVVIRLEKRKYNKENKTGIRNSWLLRKYKITGAEYTRMLQEQGCICLICGKTGKKMLAVDHDHKTNKVRGLLCSKCNLGLGAFNDNAELLLKAITYLNERK